MTILSGCQALTQIDQTLTQIDWTPPWTSPAPEKVATEEIAVIEPQVSQEPEAVDLDRTEVKRLQAQLARLGFRPGPVDGVLGERTNGAVRRYQKAHELPVTGEVSSRFLVHLEAAATRASVQEPPPPATLNPRDFPMYESGTTFVYSNGDVETVRRVDGTTVQWARQDGTTYSASRNFLIPWLYWSSGGERGKTTLSEEPEALWPLREGTAVTFSAKVAVQRKDLADTTDQRLDRWHCRNDGRRDVTVPAGTFKTTVFVCRRETDPASPDFVRTWYYANSVRHFVRHVESDPERNTTTNVDLVAIRPGAPNWPPIVRAALARAITHTLDAEAREARTPWTSSAVNARVTIEATSPFVSDDGNFCRRFTQIWFDNETRRQFPALACRTGVESWEIPGLETDTEVSLEPATGLL